MDKNKCDQLKIISEPLVKFLKENYNPHCRIVIDFDGVRVVEDVFGIPNEEKAAIESTAKRKYDIDGPTQLQVIQNEN